MKPKNLPLGRETDYPQKYAPETLCPVTRSESREPLGIREPLPFHGVDIWNAWELTWLNERSTPISATAEIRIPAESPNLIESKSLKLYLGSFAMSRFADRSDVTSLLEADLAECAGAPVDITLDADVPVRKLEGICIDSLHVACEANDVDAGLLVADSDHVTSVTLHTHLLRSLCPVTGQPDIASLQVSYEGPQIEPGSLLQYVVSFREHNDFHEACVERMFVDIMEKCQPDRLQVYARYTRRGGIDINPFRSTGAAQPPNTRLWRQ